MAHWCGSLDIAICFIYWQAETNEQKSTEPPPKYCIMDPPTHTTLAFTLLTHKYNTQTSVKDQTNRMIQYSFPNPLSFLNKSLSIQVSQISFIHSGFPYICYFFSRQFLLRNRKQFIVLMMPHFKWTLSKESYKISSGVGCNHKRNITTTKVREWRHGVYRGWGWARITSIPSTVNVSRSLLVVNWDNVDNWR